MATERVNFLKKNWKWIVVLIILISGFYLRAYHIDYPVIGYHNVKETHYLSEARNFAREGFFEHGVFVPEWDYPKPGHDPSGAHSDTFPTTSIVVSLAFKIFGYELWTARLTSILFALGSIFLFYLIIKKLFGREDLALVSAAIMSINPLLVFFGRQIQLINAALFFCLLGTFYYLKWRENKSWPNTILFIIPLLLGILTKYSFVLFAAPIALSLFSKEKELKKELIKNWKIYTFMILMTVLSIIWVFYSYSISKNIGMQLSSINIVTVFTGSFWSIMKSYLADNYTLIGVGFAIFGLILFLLFFMKNKEKFGYKFMLCYAISAFIWFIVLAKKMSGHNYHQYPILPLVVFMIAYSFVFLGVNLAKITKIKYLSTALIIILLLVLCFPSMAAKDRMFDTQFPGLDVAGNYLSTHKQPGERLMHSSHQAYGILWHADIKGTGKIPKEIEEIKFAEERFNTTWIFIYHWDFNIFNEERWNYIKNNYSLKQIGFLTKNKEFQPVYLLLKKGGSFDINQLEDILKGKSAETKEYELTKGKIVFNYITFD